MSLNKTVESRSRICHIWFVCNCLYIVLVHEDFERLSFQHFAMNWFSLSESGAICAERNGHFDRNFGNYPHKSGFLKAPYMASHQKMMWELGLTYQDEDVEQVVLESVPPCTWFDYGYIQVSEAANSYQGLNTFSASVRSNKFFFTSPSITAAMMVSPSESLWDCEPSTFPPLRYPPPSRTDPPPTHTLTINTYTLA